MFGHNEIVGKKYFDKARGDQLFVTSMFMTLQGEGPYRGEPAFFIRLAKCNLNCSFCFPANTKIQMNDGKQKKIKDVATGDEVVAWDEKTQQFVAGKVTETFKRQTDKLVRINLTQGQPTWCTPEHPFLVKNKGWVEAQHLAAGDVLLHYSVSDRMTMFNPMFNDASKQKTAESLSTIENRVRASNAMIERFNLHPTMREDLRARMSSDANPMKDPAVAAKGFLRRKDRGKKSGVEKRFEVITAGLPIKFVGDGSLEIRHKFPDFVVTGQKKLIEVWAEDARHAQNRDENWKQNRAAIFAKDGYETLFVSIPPGSKADVASIRQTVSEYIHNGNVVTSIDIIEQGSGAAWTQFAGTKNGLTDVYNFEVENYHTYVANGNIVHNCDTFFDDGDWLTFDEIEERIETTIDAFYAAKNIDRPQWTQHELIMEDVPNYVQPITLDPVQRIKSWQKKKMVLVMTGGEPMLQNNLGPFLERMSSIFTKTQIESNGTQNTEIPDSTTLVVSPKCLEKNGVAVKYLAVRPEVLARASCLKFVMEANTDSPYSSIPDWAHEWAQQTGKPVFISPMNVYNTIPQKAKDLRAKTNQISMEERSTVDEVISAWEPGLLDAKSNQANHEYAAQYCVKHGFIFNMQIHLFASLA